MNHLIERLEQLDDRNVVALVDVLEHLIGHFWSTRCDVLTDDAMAQSQRESWLEDHAHYFDDDIPF